MPACRVLFCYAVPCSGCHYRNIVAYLLEVRLHAQALTLAALVGAAVVEYYDHKSGAKAERVAKFLEKQA